MSVKKIDVDVVRENVIKGKDSIDTFTTALEELSKKMDVLYEQKSENFIKEYTETLVETLEKVENLNGEVFQSITDGLDSVAETMEEVDKVLVK